MHPAQPSKHETMETQIVIIGVGGAGLAAAVAATEKGADVILLEKRRALGGNSAMAEGLFAAGSSVQKRMKIDVRADELFKIAMNYAHWQLDARLLRAYINKSADTIQWLEDKGLKFGIYPYYPNQFPFVWHCLKSGDTVKRGGFEIIKALVKDCEGLGVLLFRETGAKKLMTDRKGHVTGVVAVTRGKELRITARSVIIATGGYGGNKELLRKYYPYYNENMVLKGVPNKGDGLLMATEIGAATEGLGILHLAGNSPRGAFDLHVVAEEPNTLWVNKKGERFVDEAISFQHFESTNALVRQPDGVGYTLLDERIKQNMIEKGVIKGLGLKALPGTKLTDLGKELELAAEKDKDWIKIAKSWDEIAQWMGAQPEVLKATIDEYNAYCEQGYDEIFAKDRRYLDALRTPPYYALKYHARYLGTIGGIKINHHMEVLDQEDNPIPGLYAAGIDTGGWESDTYCVRLAGTTFGFAINSGRIAGENAAKYVEGGRLS